MKEKIKNILNKLAVHKIAINTFVIAFCCISLFYSPNVFIDLILATVSLICLYLNYKA
jgi:hypothetical protein